MGAVYLLHFDRPYRHARHYLGWTSSKSPKDRIAAHRAGRGARLMEVIARAGIGFVLAKVWPGGRELERKLKNRGSSVRCCPLCRGRSVQDVYECWSGGPASK